MRTLTKKIIVPCEVAVKDVIPAIKAILVIELSARNYSQKEIAEFLSISIAEVNYLLKGKRGDEELKKTLLNDEDFMDLVKSFTQKLISSSVDGTDPISMCPLCSYARRKVLKQEESCPYDIS